MPSPTATTSRHTSTPAACPTTDTSAARRPRASARPIANSTPGPGITTMRVAAAVKARRFATGTICP
ncbi:Uncharacterised protein [Mycobacteroides abscessus subsp. abscessus]|nr:Uncharacterised protein [Mycobacteroides abscessus subsp. abscessus]